MNKKIITMIAIAAIVIFLLFVIFSLGKNETRTSYSAETVDQTEIVETTVSITEAPETIPGVEIWANEETVETQEKTAPTEETTAPTEEPTAPTEETTEPTEDTEVGSEYLWYASLSAEEQQKYFESFKSPEAFFEWFNKAKDEYEASREYVDISGNPNVDLGEILGGNG